MKMKKPTGKSKHSKGNRLIMYKPVWTLKNKSSKINYIYKKISLRIHKIKKNKICYQIHKTWREE